MSDGIKNNKSIKYLILDNCKIGDEVISKITNNIIFLKL